MALLHLPLTLTSAGTFERAGTDENIVDSRLRLFLLSGMGEYLRLPSPGVRALWIQLFTMGPSSRFCDAIPEGERESLENTIKEELNLWLDGIATVYEVHLLGNEREENGIRFATESRDTTFHFRFARPGMIGCWNIIEESHALH